MRAYDAIKASPWDRAVRKPTTDRPGEAVEATLEFDPRGNREIIITNANGTQYYGSWLTQYYGSWLTDWEPARQDDAVTALGKLARGASDGLGSPQSDPGSAEALGHPPDDQSPQGAPGGSWARRDSNPQGASSGPF